MATVQDQNEFKLEKGSGSSVEGLLNYRDILEVYREEQTLDQILESKYGLDSKTDYRASRKELPSEVNSEVIIFTDPLLEYEEEERPDIARLYDQGYAIGVTETDLRTTRGIFPPLMGNLDNVEEYNVEDHLRRFDLSDESIYLLEQPESSQSSL